MLPSADVVLRGIGLLAIFVGLGMRRRGRLCVAFLVYLALGLAAVVLKMLGLVDWAVWGTIAALQAAASVATALEVAARTYHRELAGGRAALGRHLLLGLVVGLAGLIAWSWQYAPATPREWYFALAELDRRLNALAAGLCLLVLAFSARHWTLDAWHRDLLAGLLFYRLGFIVLTAWPLSPWWSWLYALTLAWWTWAAWRPDEPLPQWPTWLVALVFPWRLAR